MKMFFSLSLSLSFSRYCTLTQISESLWEMKMQTMNLDVKVCMWPEADFRYQHHAHWRVILKCDNPPFSPLIALALFHDFNPALYVF